MASNATEARRASIVDRAVSAGLASVDQLAAEFGVTPSTIRRDLAKLTAEGRLARTYGGVMPLSSHAESTLGQRRGEAHAAKVAIASRAAKLVREGDTVLLDAGSTVAALAHEVRGLSPLTVATVSLTVLEELGDAEGVTTQCLGGRLRNVSQGLVGPITEAALERISCDTVFLGTDAVSADGEICEADLEQTRLKELMVRRAEHVVVLAHGAKIGARPFHAWLKLPGTWTLITDNTADAGVLTSLRKLGVTVEVVELP